MQSDPHVQAVLETVAELSGVPLAQLARQPEADLLAQLGLDSIQLLSIWAALESRFGLPGGALGVSQATTVAAMASELARLRGHSGMALPLELAAIQEFIPHRPPILLLDRVTELEPGQRGVGVKKLAEGDPCFAGHFPGQPILPGVLIVEACAQLIAVVCRSAGGSPRGASPHGAPIEYLASIERFKFLSPAVPGDMLTLEARIGRRAGGLLQARVSVRASDRPIAEGVLSVTDRQ